MNIPKSIAEFKRNAKGCSFTMFRHDWFPHGKLMNVTRYVIKQQTNEICLCEDKDATDGSWLRIPKRNDVAFLPSHHGDDSFILMIRLKPLAEQWMAYRVGEIR